MRKSKTYRNEIKSYIVRTGMTMTEVVDYLSNEYGWSRSVPNLSGKLKRGSLRYGEAVELADALGYDIVWQKRKVPPVTNASSAVFPVKSRTSKISVLWRTGVTI